MFSYINEDGKIVRGAAAFNHFVYSICGGVNQYNDLVGSAYVNNWIKDNSNKNNNTIERLARKSYLKVVDN